MKLKSIQALFQEELGAAYPREEVNSFFYRLIEHYLGLDRFVLVLEPDYRISKKAAQPLFEALTKLRQNYPLQYILGQEQFMGYELLVNEQVLIPRPETEELVRWVLTDPIGKAGNPKILDIGTGSGCIAISLAGHWPHARVSALDISADALGVARENASRNKVKIEWILADILENDLVRGSWDLIVSNPPYVREQEKAAMHDNVKRYEPANALFVPDKTPLVFYEGIADFAAAHLNVGGALYLEINQYLAEETTALLRERNFLEIEGKKDMFGNDRMLRATAPGWRR